MSENGELPAFVSVFSYDDHRRFVKDAYKLQKQQNKDVNWRGFARKLGISDALLKMLLSGNRNFTVEHIHAFADYLSLTGAEHEYFEALVLKNQAKTARQRSYYEDRISKILPAEKHQAVKLDPRLLDHEWYIPGLIIYLLKLATEAGEEGLGHINPLQAAKDLGIPEDKVRRTLDQLVRLGVIASENERVVFTLNNLSGSLSQKRLVRRISEESIERLKSSFDDERTFFHASSFTILPSELVKLKKDIRLLIDEYSQRAEDGGAQKQEVYQSVIHFWPFR